MSLDLWRTVLMKVLLFFTRCHSVVVIDSTLKNQERRRRPAPTKAQKTLDSRKCASKMMLWLQRSAGRKRRRKRRDDEHAPSETGLKCC